MFDSKRIHELVELHEKSFALLRWVKASLKRGSLSFSLVHDTTDSAAAATEWIRRHFENIPPDARPGEAQIPMFSRLFVSFLTTSFRLNANSRRLVSACGCRCFYCAYLQAGPNLDPRMPSKKDAQIAGELKRIDIGKLAYDMGVSHASQVVERLLGTSDLATDISMATWGAELVRRSEFASQGEAVLALWRQFAWQNNSPKPRFKITAKKLIDAEQDIVQSIRAADVSRGLDVAAKRASSQAGS
jgi:hypothetical protein